MSTQQRFLMWITVILIVISMAMFSVACKETEPTEQVEQTTTEEADTEEVQEETHEASEEVVIRIWKGPHAAEEREKIFNDLIDAFEADHPGVTIEFTNTPWDTMIEKYTTAFASGNPPDIFYSFTGGYVDSVMPQCVDYREAFSDEELDFILKGIPENLLAEFTIGDKLLGAPWLTIGNTLVYNIDMLQEAGYDAPPQTWEEQLEYCIALTNDIDNDGNIDQYGYGQLTYDTAEAKPEYFLYEAGFELFNKDMSGIDYDDEGAIAAFEYIDQLWNIEKVAVPVGLYPGTTMIDAFFDGKFAMWQCHAQINVVAREHPDFNMGVSLMPAGPGTDLLDGRGTYVGQGAWTIAQDTKNLDIVKEFLMYFYDPEYLIPILERFGFTASRADVTPDLDQVVLDFAESYVNYGIPYRFGTEVNEVKESVWNAMQSLQSGAIGPDDAWMEAVENGNAAFE